MLDKPGQARKPSATEQGTRAIERIPAKPFVHVIIIIALGLIIYMNTLEAPFVFDDEGIIVNNPALRDAAYFTDRDLLDKAIGRWNIDEHFRSRIVGYLTFSLNYKLHALKVRGYHILNTLVHLANALLVYLLVLLTTKTPWFSKAAGNPQGHSLRSAAFFAALLFVSHPVQTGAVTYITQRFTSLAAMFCLLSVVMYSWFRQAGSEGVEDSPRRDSAGRRFFVSYVLSLLSAVLAMKTKEMSFTLPVVIALYEVMFFEGKARKRLLYLLPLLLTMLIIPITVFGESKTVTEIKRIGETMQGGQAENTALDYLLTQFRVIVTYLRLLVLPLNQNLDYDYPVYRSFFRPEVFLSFIFLAVVFIVGVYLYRRSSIVGIQGRNWLRMTAFGIFWFFITLSVESSIIPLVDVIFEHRLYLPSTGFFMVIVSLSEVWLIRVGKTGAKAVTILLTAAVILLSAASLERNKLWTDSISLWEDIVKKSPNKARTHYNLGKVYDSQGHTDKAVSEYLSASRINPYYADTHYNLANIYVREGRTDKAIAEYVATLRINPDHAGAHNNLGHVYTTIGLYNEAADEFQEALRLNPYDVVARSNLDIILGILKNGSVNPDH